MVKPTKFGKYLLLERIAVGGMAEVFVAKAFGVEGFERLLAIKKILPMLGEDREFTRMFVDEARIAVQLTHPNIVQVLELGKHEGSLYIAMEYVSGRDLRQVMERYRRHKEPMPLPQACLMVAEVCEALDHAHRKEDAQGRPLGIVHRDVSPQNVLVGFEGAVKLIDFGIAKAERRLSQTQSGILKGKFSYMSPEQVKGLPLDGRSDVFACGVLLWEMISGEKLFTGESDVTVLERVRKAAVPPLRNCPPELARVVQKALAADPAQRHPTASALHDELRRFTLTGGNVFGARQLGEWLRQEFREEWEKEQERLRSWTAVAGGPLSPELPSPQRKEPRRDAPAHDTLIGDEPPTVQMEGGALLGADGASGTLLLPPAEAAAAIDAALQRAPTPQRRLAEPTLPPTRTRRWAYALAPVAVAALGIVYVAAWSGDEARPGKLVIAPSPPVAAELVIDGRSSGPLPPFVRTVPAGKHHLEVRAPGYLPFTAEVDVPAGGRLVEVAAPLAPQTPGQMEGGAPGGPAGGASK
ncbi:MAG TPA: serine/threonine-protein kinase [Myxococcales bacterium]|nr:serine/threonine-protein kinase [Myxococcales bacterium]